MDESFIIVDCDKNIREKLNMISAKLHISLDELVESLLDVYVQHCEQIYNLETN